MAIKDKSKTTSKDEETAIVKTEEPGALAVYDYGEDAGSGFEHQTSADASIPFIVVLQALSPNVVERSHPMALPGNFYNTVTEQYYDRDKGFLFVPSTTRHMYGRWVPRDQGGGFRGHVTPEDQEVQKAIKNSQKFGKYLNDDGLQLTETFYVYGAVCTEEGDADGMALIAFTSTKIKAYKKWMTRVRALRIPIKGREPVQPPLCANLTRFVAGAEKNTKGSFFVFSPQSGDPRGLMQSLLMPTDPRFQMAKACRELVDSGKAKVDFDKQEKPADGEETPF